MTKMTSKICRPPIRKPRASSPRTSYTPGQLAKRYGFYPPPATQTQWVAVISLGGGYSDADIQAYCAQYGLPVPPVRFVGIQGATNDYSGDGNGPDGENALDIQNIIGATGGKVGIIMYGAPNSDSGFAAAIAQVAKDNIACVCTISWGASEPNWTEASLTAMNAAIQACVAAGIPVFVASGDDGSSDGSNGNNVDFPASSPYAVGCGGTTLTQSGETAWNSGGGGVSVNFPRTSYQASLSPALGDGRLVPDLALDADPNSGYPTVLDSVWDTYGGTSAVGPMMAGGVALAVSATGHRVDPNKLLAAAYSGQMTDITKGSNTSLAGSVAPKFNAGVGFDLCTGNGVPNSGFWALVTGTTVPPPPPSPPPPVQPPPVSPPPPPPPVTPPAPPTLKQQLDAIFAELKVKYARNPLLLWAINTTQGLVDTYLAHSALRATLPHASILQGLVDEILDALLKTVTNPMEIIAIQIVKGLIDSLLSSQS